MFEHYSYTENIDVRWVMFSCYAYFAALLLYSLSFGSTTWISETGFNIVGMLLWAIVFRMASRHRVMRMLAARTDASKDSNVIVENDIAESIIPEDNA